MPEQGVAGEIGAPERMKFEPAELQVARHPELEERRVVRTTGIEPVRSEIEGF